MLGVNPNLISVGTIFVQLAGGLALFLFGMEQMTGALKIVAGTRLKNLLAAMTTNRFKGVLAGIIITAIVQSSSVTTVMLVGFISAGLMTLKQSVGIMMGAGIGSTFTAQIVAFKVTQYALVLVAAGFLVLFVARSKQVQQYGTMLMGLGLIFFGMTLMGDATRPLRGYQPFLDLMRQLENPLLGILVGLFFTAVIQSSAATMVVVITLAGQGLLSLEAGIGLALGANIGTTVTALLASIGRPREAVQLAVLHSLYRLAGVILCLPFLEQLATAVRFISPAYPHLTGLAQIAAEAPRQIANAHTLANIVMVLAFIWFVEPMVKLMNWLIPLKPQPESMVLVPRYLDYGLINAPGVALDAVRLELGRLGDYTAQMVRQALPTVIHGTEDDLVALAAMDDNVDGLHGAIVTYLGRLSQENLGVSDSRHLSDYMAVANHIENIGDMVETNMVEAGDHRLRHLVDMSPHTQELLAALHQKVCWSVQGAVKALSESNQPLAEEIMAAKFEVNQLANAAEEHLAHRLIADEPNRLATFRIETEIIEYLKRVYYFAKRIAKVTTDADLVYRQVVLKSAVEESAVR